MPRDGNSTDIIHAQLVGIDWGTSNRRADLIGADGQVLFFHEDHRGTLAARGSFAESLAELLAASVQRGAFQFLLKATA